MNKVIILFIIIFMLTSCSNPTTNGRQEIAKLGNNYPNPFNPTTTINFYVTKNCHIQLTIYNDQKEIVKTLINTEIYTGNHSVVWYGRDNDDNSVASGTYYYELKTDNYYEIKEMLLLK